MTATVREYAPPDGHLAHVGLAAAGTMHDLINPLTALIGYCDMALVELDHTHPAYELVTHARRAAQPIVDLRRSFLAFARGDVPAPDAIGLGGVVSGCAGMLRKVVGPLIAIDLELASDLPLVACDPGKIERVLLNLVVNASEAIEGVGAITIATRRGAGTAEIVVSDDGCGMSEEQLARLFTPGATTKAEGNGIGLTSCLQIVQGYGGWITVESAEGYGTVVTVSLPAAG